MQIAQNVASSVLGNDTNIDIQIKFSDNLYSDALEICENSQYCDFLLKLSSNEISYCNKLNGLYLLPKDISSYQIILISNRQIKDGFSYISTVAHETQHAKNHTEFCKMYCNDIFENISTHLYNVPFQIFDEFMARKVGHRVFTAFTMQKKLNYSKDDVIWELQNNQLKVRLEEINQLLQQTNSVEQYKNIAGILARFDVWKTDYGISVPNLNYWCAKFYQSLSIYQSIKDVNFDKLHATLRSLWDMRQ